MDVIAWQPLVHFAEYHLVGGTRTRPKLHLGLRGWLRCPVCKSEREEVHSGVLMREHLRLAVGSSHDAAGLLRFEAESRLCHGQQSCQECGVVSVVPQKQINVVLESLPAEEVWLTWVLEAIGMLEPSDHTASRRAPSPDDYSYEITELEGGVKDTGREVCWERITMEVT